MAYSKTPGSQWTPKDAKLFCEIVGCLVGRLGNLQIKFDDKFVQ